MIGSCYSRAFHHRFNQEPRRVPFPNTVNDAFYSHQKAGLLQHHCMWKRNGKEEDVTGGIKHRPTQSETSANNFYLVPTIDKDEAGN